METIPLHIDPTTHAALQKAARESQWDVQDVVMDAIKRDLFRRTYPKKAIWPDARLIAPLRALLADDFNHAKGWSDLQERLRQKGFMLQEAGAGLAVIRCDDGRKCAKASDLGHSYPQLMRRFSAPFPGHSHHYLFERAM
ncbi:MAG: hypothetical protein ACSHXH_05085 [Marivita sp.]|uniref:hypothetical protein n=1 Tax=Marivita sp. TaxID=2003365 RepID=UPI003EFB00DC